MNGNFLNLAQTIREKHKINAGNSSWINFINLQKRVSTVTTFLRL